MPVRRSSIRTKLLAAFLAMGGLISALGIYSFHVLSDARAMVTATYDGTLMAVNYGRAAAFDFAEMQKTAMEDAHASSDRHHTLKTDLDQLSQSFEDDLNVALSRSSAPDEQRVVAEIRSLKSQWLKAFNAGDTSRRVQIGGRILDRFDMLLELNADHSFVERRKAVTAIDRFQTLSGSATLVALLLALLITFVLARRIVHPLSAAARVADKVAAGDFETLIPAGGEDETGALLHSMTVMQSNIRDMMVREQAQRESAEARLIDALETSDEGVMLVQPDESIAMVNGKLRDFFPAAKDVLAPGVHFSVAFSRLLKDLATADESSLASLQDDLLNQRMEGQLPDGRWIRAAASPSSEGGMIIFFSDFTNMKMREEGERHARIVAEEASQTKSRFLANMSHELRTPLNAIIGFSEIIEKQVLGPAGNARYVNYASDIVRSGRHLLDIINSVLDLARTDAGKMKLQTEPLSLSALLGDCVIMVQQQCEAAGLIFVAEGLNAELPVLGDASKLRQIFLNLLSNAIKFTHPGGRISLIAGQLAGGGVSVSVTDTGIGMSGDDIALALTPFGQVDNRLQRRYEGTGLGLPLAKALLDLHEGRFEIESAPGKGTAVTVILPAAVMQQNAVAA